MGLDSLDLSFGKDTANFSYCCVYCLSAFHLNTQKFGPMVSDIFLKYALAQPETCISNTIQRGEKFDKS